MKIDTFRRINCIEKLTALLEENQVTIMWTPGLSGIQENKTADRLARGGARIRPIGLEPFLPLSFSSFKSKIRKSIGKRKYGIKSLWRLWDQLTMEGPTNWYVQFVSKQDRKHKGLLTGYINLQYNMLHMMRRAKTPSCHRYVAEKGNVGTDSMWIPSVGKDKDLGLCQDRVGANKRGEAEQYCSLQ